MAATTETGTLSVSATVVNACAIGDGTLAFGSDLKLAVASDGTKGTTADVTPAVTNIAIICTNGASAGVTAASANDSSGVKNLKSGSNLLAYEIYSDSDLTKVIGSTATSYTGTGASTSFPIYGKIAGSALAAAAPGSYTDTVTLTVTYTP